MDNDSDGLRAALRAAEEAIRAAIGETDPIRAGDQAGLKDLQEAFGLVTGRRRELEAGKWSGRSVASYPQGREQIRDGMS